MSRERKSRPTGDADAQDEQEELVGMALAGLEAHHRNTSGRVHSTAEGRVPSATCRGPQENKTATMEQVARAFLSTCSIKVERTQRFPMCDV